MDRKNPEEFQLGLDPLFAMWTIWTDERGLPVHGFCQRLWLGQGRREEKRAKKLFTISVMVGRKLQKGLVDTASACFLVQRELVNSHWIIPGATMDTECVHGDQRNCPIAQVPLEVWGRFWWKQVGVMEGLPYPVVLSTD